MDQVASIDFTGEEDAVDEVDAGVQFAGFDHADKFGFDRRFGGIEGSCEGGKCDTGEGDEVLLDGFSADLEIYVIQVFLQVDVQQVVGFVAVEDGEAGGVLGGDEVGDGAPDVRLQLKIATEGFVLKDSLLKIFTAHGGESAETAVYSDVVGRQDFVVGFLVLFVVHLGSGHSRVCLQEFLGRVLEISRGKE